VLEEAQRPYKKCLGGYFSPDRNTLASSNDKTVRLWDSHSRASLRVFKGHTKEVGCLAFISDSTTLFSGSLDGTIRMRYTRTGELWKTLVGHTAAVLDIARPWLGQMHCEKL
jgi:WD40 repeat protein